MEGGGGRWGGGGGCGGGGGGGMLDFFFFFNDTATTEIYTLSLHDALPIFAPIYPQIEADDPAVSPPVHIIPTDDPNKPIVITAAQVAAAQDATKSVLIKKMNTTQTLNQRRYETILMDRFRKIDTYFPNIVKFASAAGQAKMTIEKYATSVGAKATPAYQD